MVANSKSFTKLSLGMEGGVDDEYSLSAHIFMVSCKGMLVNSDETSKLHVTPLLCLYEEIKSTKLKVSLTV